MIICFVTLSVTDLQTADILIDTSSEDQSSSWAWVSDDMKKGSSGIDNEDYEIVNEESVEDAFADFIAKSVLSNPNAQVYIYNIPKIYCLSFTLRTKNFMPSHIKFVY